MSGAPGSPATLVSLGQARTRRAARRAATAERLVAAAVEEIRDVGYAGLTVRNVSRRAGVAPATAYSHFTSKDHLIVAAFWRLLAALPPVRPELPGSRGLPERVATAIADVARLVTDEPDLAAAATTAMFADEPEVARLRRRIGTSFHERFAAALDERADDQMLETLDLAFSGALVRAGVGELPYSELGPIMARVAGPSSGGDPGGPRPDAGSDDGTMPP